MEGYQIDIASQIGSANGPIISAEDFIKVQCNGVSKRTGKRCISKLRQENIKGIKIPLCEIHERELRGETLTLWEEEDDNE